MDREKYIEQLQLETSAKQLEEVIKINLSFSIVQKEKTRRGCQSQALPPQFVQVTCRSAQIISSK